MDKLKAYMAHKGLTGEAFAELVGVAPSTISRILKNHQLPKVDLALRIQAVTRGKVSVRAWAGGGAPK